MIEPGTSQLCKMVKRVANLHLCWCSHDWEAEKEERSQFCIIILKPKSKVLTVVLYTLLIVPPASHDWGELQHHTCVHDRTWSLGLCYGGLCVGLSTNVVFSMLWWCHNTVYVIWLLHPPKWWKRIWVIKMDGHTHKLMFTHIHSFTVAHTYFTFVLIIAYAKSSCFL